MKVWIDISNAPHVRFFKDVIKYLEKNKHKYVVHILEQNLTEKEALQIESWYINEYICNYGFKLTNKNVIL